MSTIYLAKIGGVGLTKEGDEPRVAVYIETPNGSDQVIFTFDFKNAQWLARQIPLLIAEYKGELN